MRLTVLYCDTRGIRRGIVSDDLPDQDQAAVEPIARLLRRLGHDVLFYGARFDNLPDLPASLRSADAVVNLCDGSGVDGSVGPSAPALLQHLGIPFTGCSVDPYLLSIDKALVRRALARAHVPVPAGRVFASEDMVGAASMAFPVIVKPREGYGSLGIDRRCVVFDPAQLSAAVRRARLAGDGDVLVEQFLPGRELSVGVIGPADAPLLLPPVEFQFGRTFRGRPAVRTLRSKHDPNSAEYRDVSVRRASLTRALEAEVSAISETAWRALGGDGYGRVDLRLDESGRPFVIEVNANCSLEMGPEPCDCGTMVLAARLAGWEDERLLGSILEAGLARASRGLSPIRSTMSGRWTPATGHSAHALRPIDQGEILGHLGDAEPAGRAARRPWQIGEAWVAPAPPLRSARAVAAADADAHVEAKDGQLILSAARPIDRFEEIRVGGTCCRRGTRIHVRTAA